MKSIGDMSLGELAAFVATHLRKHDIDVALSGGSCVSIYSNGAYVSSDLDFVDNHFTKRAKIRDALSEIGFLEERRYFKHRDTDFLMEFLTGPLSVGEEPVRQTIWMQFETGILKIISPTDCVKDRLAAYFHWHDRQCLEQAVLVAKDTDIDLDEIERWSEQEGKLGEFLEIKKRLEKQKHKSSPPGSNQHCKQS